MTDVKTSVKIPASKCNIGGNVFALISTAYMALTRAGYDDLAEEMSSRIRKNANSPDEVLEIVKEYVTIV